jgi:cation diffusion facilitator CzcD-associated flavoprotein CzcO
VKNLTTGETFIDEADVVVGARGAFTRILWPEIDGLWDFAGKIVHSGHWDET